MQNQTISILGGGWLGKPLADFLESKGYLIKISTASKENYDRLKKIGKNAFQLMIQSDAVEGDATTFLEADILIINITPNRAELDKEQLASLIPLIATSTIQNVLFISSTSVYPNLNRIVFEEEAIETHHLYQSEQALLKHPGFETTVVRMAGLVGGERHPGQFFRKSGRIKNAQAPINLIHRVDCLEIIYQIIRQNCWGEIFNACSDNHPSKEHFYPIAAKAIGMDIPVCCQLTDSVSFKIVSSKKIKEQLGIVLQYPDLLQLVQTKKWV